MANDRCTTFVSEASRDKCNNFDPEFEFCAVQNLLAGTHMSVQNRWNFHKFFPGNVMGTVLTIDFVFAFVYNQRS